MSRDAGRLPICALYRRHGFLKFNQNFFYQNIRPITKASLEEKKTTHFYHIWEKFPRFPLLLLFFRFNIYTFYRFYGFNPMLMMFIYSVFQKCVQNMLNWRNPSVIHIEQFWFSTFDNIHKMKWLIQQRKTLTSRNVLYENSLTQKPPAIKIFHRDAHNIVESRE